MFAIFKKLYPFAKPDMNTFIIGALCAIPVAAIKGYQVYFIKKIFDEGLAADASPNLLLKQCGVLIGLQCIQYPLRFYHFYTLRRIVESVVCKVRGNLFAHFQRLPLSFFDKKKQGELLSISTYDTLYFSNAMLHVTGFFREPITAIVFLGIAFYHDWALALFLLAAIPLFGALLAYTGKKIKKHTKHAQAKMGVIAQRMTETVRNHKVVKAYNLQDFFEKKFEKEQETYFNSQNRSISYEEHSYPSIETIGTFATCLILAAAHERIVGEFLTTGAFISFAVAMSMFMDPVKKFNRANVGINQARAAADRIFGIIEIPAESDGGSEECSLKETIEFKGVCFKYNNEMILENFNLLINKGERIGIVGRSGSGKSTVISLLLGLYPVSSGKILIDGEAITSFKKEKLRGLFSYVGQDVFLFQDSVKNNLSLDHKFSDDEINKSLEIVQGHFVKSKTDGLETMVGDRGSQFSGGEAQRLTLARAVLQNRSVVLLDEATSALDNKSEQLIKDALEQVLESKTVVAVAHRLSTLQGYDRIIVLEQGKILEQGSHEQLLQKEGEYKKLYELSLG